MVTIRDILNFHPEIYPELEEFAKIREETKKLKRVQRVRGKMQDEEGICSECGNPNVLFDIEGMLVCESCRNSMQ